MVGTPRCPAGAGVGGGALTLPKNSVPEFRRCVNARECLIFAYENTRSSSAAGNDVSRARESRFELRMNFLCRRAHNWNFLPAYMHGEKAGA